MRMPPLRTQNMPGRVAPDAYPVLTAFGRGTAVKSETGEAST